MKNIDNTSVYLKRMAMPIQDKLRAARFIPKGSEMVLDIGCADGSISLALAAMFPEIKFKGIDLNDEFIKNASGKAIALKLQNINFENIYLRDLLKRPERFDAVSFISVLHEFYTYGEGISSVVKALADAHELLRSGGVIIIRDMILDHYAKDSEFFVKKILSKIKANKSVAGRLKGFEKISGKIETIYSLNHFLLKYSYKENWTRELRENYVPVTFDQYENIFKLLGMELDFKDSYLLSFLRDKWKSDFGLTDEECSLFRSTGFLAGRKK